MKLNIIFLFSSFEHVGPLKLALNIAEHLPADSYRIIFVAISDAKHRCARSAIEQSGFLAINLGIPRWRFLFDARRVTKRFSNLHLSPNIVHSHLLRADYLSSKLKLCSLAKVSTVHNNPFLDYSFTYGRLLGGLAALFHVHALAPIDAVVGCSFSVSDVISRSLKRPVSTIQVGVSNIEGACKNKKDNLTYARSIINVPLSTTVFLSVCNLISRKDVETIIKGFKLANLPRDCLLLIVGAGPDEGRLRSLISQDNIRLIGWVESVSDFFSAADFFVSASLSEGLPAAPVEAMCRGVIPILSDIPPHRELLSGVDKPLIFTPGDYRGLSVILKTALSIERGKLSSDVSTYARQKFSAETMSKNYDLIYKGLKSQRLMDKDSTYKS